LEKFQHKKRQWISIEESMVKVIKKNQGNFLTPPPPKSRNNSQNSVVNLNKL